jgi:phage regulator Rha-like protein
MTNSIVAHADGLEALTSREILRMTSGEIATLVEKRHDNVKRAIESLAERGTIQLPQTEVSEKINGLGLSQKVTHYVFTAENKRDSFIVVAQLSPEFTARLVDRWQELELKNSQRQAEIEQEEMALRLWKHDREKAATGYRRMMRHMDEQLSYLPKDKLVQEKMREADALNYILVGMSSQSFKYWFETDNVRDELAYVQLEALNAMQTFNASLMAVGSLEPSERWELVEAYFAKEFPSCKLYRDQTYQLLKDRLEPGSYHLRPTSPKQSPLLNPIARQADRIGQH